MPLYEYKCFRCGTVYAHRMSFEHSKTARVYCEVCLRTTRLAPKDVLMDRQLGTIAHFNMGEM